MEAGGEVAIIWEDTSPLPQPLSWTVQSKLESGLHDSRLLFSVYLFGQMVPFKFIVDKNA